MAIKSESATLPPRIGKIGPYTVFLTPPATPNASPVPESKIPARFQTAHSPVQLPSAPRVMAPPAQLDKEKHSSFAFFWDTLVKVQNGCEVLEEEDPQSTLLPCDNCNKT